MTGFFLKASKQAKKLSDKTEKTTSLNTESSQEPSCSSSSVELTDESEVEVVQPPSKYFIIKKY